ncbi:ASCH domain-containing protein [Bosea sp. CRIB-10]|uniref:ASCH domain-containing protein n=1 Tax=Bosea sp. CRIB-10 TaxID=378404 RepID=UPI001587F11F|nr:ASCH domain-containing protein [Bosea sp. CRIB-10]
MAKFSEAIISIRPNFAEAILSGGKTVELRRRVPPIGVGTRLWIYATKPTGAVVGSAIVKKIVRGLPDHVWEKCGDQAGVDRETFDIYFAGAELAIGLVLTDVRRGRPVSIEKLRSIRTGFHPPQVLARISDEEAISLDQLSMVARRKIGG